EEFEEVAEVFPLEESFVANVFFEVLVPLLIFYRFNPRSNPAEGPSSLSASSGFLFFNLSATPLSIASSSSRIDFMSA
ncbi:hypothetical protein Tco_0467165, partial [Tanacetum coccineum]